MVLIVERTEQHTNTYYFTNKMFREAIKYFLAYCKKHNKRYKYIYAIPRGGFSIGLYLSHKLNIPMKINYADPCLRLDKDVLVIDDIADSGKELAKSIYRDCDKFVLIAKMKGYKKVKPIVHTIVDDKQWVVFDWER